MIFKIGLFLSIFVTIPIFIFGAIIALIGKDEDDE